MINNFTQLVIDDPLKDIINKLCDCHDPIAIAMLDHAQGNLLHKQEGFNINFLAITKGGLIAYLDDSRLTNAEEKTRSHFALRGLRNGIGYSSLRYVIFRAKPFNFYEAKPGRVVRKLFPNAFSDVEVEKFVRGLQRVVRQSLPSNMKVVEGEDIRWSYYIKNYSILGGGTLGSSCMAGERQQKYLDIYVKNPDSIKLSVVYDKEGKVGARSLVWYLDNKPKYYDRVYYINSLYEDMLVNSLRAEFPDIKYIQDGYEVSIPITNVEFKHYPYIDTLYRYKDGCLMNHGDSLIYEFRNLYGGRWNGLKRDDEYAE